MASSRDRGRVLIAGFSARAAAESAARAGFAVTAIDAFGDLDHHPSVRQLTLPTPFTAQAAAEFADGLEVEGTVLDAVTYLSNFENHPRAVEMLGKNVGGLWGNSPSVLDRVRNPRLLADAFRRRGMAVPRVAATSDSAAADVDWLMKPLASGGGHGVERWDRVTPLPADSYLQEMVRGPIGSVAFVAANRQVTVIGISRQLVGDESFGAAQYRYSGNILAGAGDPQFEGDKPLVETACALAQTVAEAFDLVGVNGIDFVDRGGVPYPIEVNPRWSGSMELIERAYGLSIFGAHAAACSTGMLPLFDVHAARRNAVAFGKAIVFARRNVTIGNTEPWLADSTVRDIPRAGERIAAGRPVCTVFASGHGSEACYSALVARAASVYAQLEEWEAAEASGEKNFTTMTPTAAIRPARS